MNKQKALLIPVLKAAGFLFILGAFHLPLNAAPAADASGTVYRVQDSRVFALTPDGQKWVYQAQTYLTGGPYLFGDLIFVTGETISDVGDPLNLGYYVYSSYLVALHSADGQVAWSSAPNGYSREHAPPPRFNPAGQISFVGQVFDAQTGALTAATVPFASAADWAPDVDLNFWQSASYSLDGTAFIANRGTISAIHGRTGSEKWKVRSFGLTSEPIIGEDGTVFTADDGNVLYGLDPITGDTYWELPGEFRKWSALVALRSNIVAVASENELFEIDGRTGTILRTRSLPQNIPEGTSLLVLPSGGMYIDTVPPIWLEGSYAYADSPWPKTNAGNDNIRTLAELGPPKIFAPPRPGLLRDARATFSVHATGTPPLRYQWFKNGQPLAGATNADYTAENPLQTDSFSATVSNILGEVTSDGVTIGFSVTGLTQGGRIRIDPRQEAYAPGTLVTATATSLNGRPLLAWAGIESTNNPLQFQVSSNTFLTALLDNRDLDLLWSFRMGTNSWRPVVSTHGIIYAPTGEGIFALDPAGQRLLWHTYANATIDAALDSENNLWIRRHGDLEKYHGETGELLWRGHYHPFGVTLFLDPRGRNYRIFDGKITAFELDNSPLWTNDSARWDGAFQGPDARLYCWGFGGSGVGEIVAALNPDTGQVLWQRWGEHVAFGARNRLSIATGPGIDKTDLVVRHSAALIQSIPYALFGTRIITPEGRTFVQEYDYRLYEILDSGELQITPSFLRSSLSTASGKIVGTHNDGLFVFDPIKGTIVGQISGMRPERRTTTLLPGGGIVLVRQPGWLNIYKSSETLAASMSPGPILNIQNSGSLLRLGPPHIITEPRNKKFIQGGAKSFAVDATGTPPLRYDWYRDGQLIQSSDIPEIVVTNLTPADLNSDFWVVITNNAGTLRSRTVGLGYEVKVLLDGRGNFHASARDEILRPGEVVQVEAIETDRPFQGWIGAITLTNPAAALTVNTNLVLTAKFEPRPGDLLWTLPMLFQTGSRIPASADYDWFDSIVFSQSRGFAVLPPHVLLDLASRKLTPLVGEGSVWGSVAQRGEDVFGVGNWENERYLVHHDLLHLETELTTIPLNMEAPSADPEGNTYFLGGFSLLKLDRNGSLVWSNNIPGFWNNGASRPSIGLDGKGILLSGTELITFDTETGAILLRTNSALVRPIIISGSRFAAFQHGQGWLSAADIATGQTIWTNTNSYYFDYVTDGEHLYSGSGRGLVSLDLQTGIELWNTPLYDARGLVLSADGKLYTKTVRSVACLDTADGSILWTNTPAPPENFFASRAFLGPDGNLYCISRSGVLHAFYAGAPVMDSIWPQSYGAGDSMSATAPPELRPVPITISRTGPELRLTFPTISSFTYELQTTANLKDNSWTPVTTLEGTGAAAEFPITPISSGTFYRLKVTRP